MVTIPIFGWFMALFYHITTYIIINHHHRQPTNVLHSCRSTRIGVGVDRLLRTKRGKIGMIQTSGKIGEYVYIYIYICMRDL